MEKIDVRACNEQELMEYVKTLAEPAFRGKQLFRQAQLLAAPDFAAMTDLPLALRQRLAEEATLTQPRILAQQVSTAGDTAKLLLEFADGEQVEMVVMLYSREKARNRATCCVSSQSGCGMGCVFCATGLYKEYRNLTAGEIVTQVQAGDALARAQGFDGISNIVFMGMGEPLNNSEQVKKAVELLNDEHGMAVGARKITISTCGIVPKIYEMASWGRQVELAVSLHAADDEKRRQLMPGAAHWSIQELMEAMRFFREKTGRRVTCEYALIQGVNDQIEDARKLGRLLTETFILVNMIPANPLPECGVRASAPDTIAAFCRVVESYGVAVQIREKRGRDIQAACGQLRKRMDAAVTEKEEDGR